MEILWTHIFLKINNWWQLLRYQWLYKRDNYNKRSKTFRTQTKKYHIMVFKNLLAILLLSASCILNNKNTVVHGQMSALNASKIFQKLMKDYDYRIIPNEDGEPLDVHVNLIIHDLVPRRESTAVSITFFFSIFFLN